MARMIWEIKRTRIEEIILKLSIHFILKKKKKQKKKRYVTKFIKKGVFRLIF